MTFKDHSALKDQHAFLSASNYHWINYTSEKLQDRYLKWRAAQRGTELHDFARRCIELGIKLPDNTKTLNRYVNDCIGFHMKPEVVLFYSNNCFGTTDCISFSEKNMILRISDLKSGETVASFHQLEVYAALFCLEYNIIPTSKLKIELRIYQSDDVKLSSPSPDTIKSIMNKIIDFDKKIEQIKSGGMLDE